MRAGEEATHQVLGRLRFLLQCSECFRRARPLPAALCYVPREVQYKICKDPSAAASSRSLLSVWDSPGPARGSKRAARATIEVRKGGCLRATGEEYCNSAGLWVKLSKVTPPALHPGGPGLPRGGGRLGACAGCGAAWSPGGGPAPVTASLSPPASLCSRPVATWLSPGRLPHRSYRRPVSLALPAAGFGGAVRPGALRAVLSVPVESYRH